MQDLLNTEIWNGKSIADYLTLDMMVSVLGNILSAIFILLIAFMVSGWVSRRIRLMSERHAKLDQTLFDFLSNLARYVILAFAVLFVLNTFGIQTTSIVAAIGAAGLAIGLALQGTLSNVAAGVMLVFFRPIKVGDFVEINDKMGTVKEINLNYVELASTSNTQVIVPNSEVWGNTITNYSVYPTRRAEWTFGVGYGVNLAKAEQVIRDTIMADERAHTDPEPFIQVNNLGGSSVDFLVRVWCDRTDYLAFTTDMTRKVKEALDEADIDIPFPTRTIVSQAS
ncbi:mechanosensitive ion channel family protein [Litoreibacter arenae]|uniref:Small-conductance mechanosensitive channel n=1 Tax=Litoreibacter arenae DSM 19593 TaxID=1123360 RepID=S9RH52_9RHOB|nr:mechanosensitive ion channel domain-containing protein [Litoreibacter arenae]EPX77420.1 Small-conductance mechanosensitive channel [Litoreibacter arenae DSM 19593]